jgi:hypothetical protein
MSTSAEAERTGSAAGIICDDKRTMLSSDMVNYLVFLSRNSRLVNWKLVEPTDTEQALLNIGANQNNVENLEIE